MTHFERFTQGMRCIMISKSKNNRNVKFGDIGEFLEDETMKNIINLMFKNGACIDHPHPCKYDLVDKIEAVYRYIWGSTFRGPKGDNLLHLFLCEGCPESSDYMDVIKILLDLGIPINEPDNDGYSPLMTAITLKNIQLAELFIQRGANTNQKSESIGTSPLYMAVEYNNPAMCELLIANGAQVDGRNIY